MRAVFQKEFLSYFRTWDGYLFLAAVYLTCGYFFTRENILAGAGDLEAVYQAFLVTLIIMIPWFTAKSFIENSGIRVEELMYVSPIKLVFGKFFAGHALVGVGLLGTWFYVIILSIFGEPYIPEILMQQLGILLVSSVFIALGLLVSTIAYRKIQAFVTMITLLLMLYFANMLMSYVSNTLYQSFFWVFSMFSEYHSFNMGIFSPASLLYLISYAVLLLLLTCGILEKRRNRGLRRYES